MSDFSERSLLRFVALTGLMIFATWVQGEDNLADKLEVPPGFKVELILKADGKVNGSWICMAKDSKGRLLLGAQNGQPVTRVTIKDGKVEKQENIQLPISETMGLLFVGESLYVTGSGKNGYSFYLCKDTKGEGKFDSVEFLRKWESGGEHGAHGIVLGADNKLYCVNGNFTPLPKDLLPSSPHRNYEDDLILKRAEDGNGFGAGKKPPGGYVVRMDLDGKNAELFGSGQRNDYDIAFNADGELFGYDSDMEWDWGGPWYRPTRMIHITSGADHGFREGSAKWPSYYFDSLPSLLDIGPGCPTGVCNGIGAKFPVKYQKAIYALDWTYGRLLAIHLKPNGASYTAEWESLVEPKGLKQKAAKTPLNLTDALIGDDGALYFTIGGRGTHAALFRVTYEGQEPAKALAAADLVNKEGAEARALRRQIEAFHSKEDPKAVETVWPHLSSPDRYIRYAARIAIERNPVAQWKARALAEKNPDAALTSLLALARLDKGSFADVTEALAKFPMTGLSESQRMDKVRLIQVAVARAGKPAGELAAKITAELNPLFPAKSIEMNLELCQVLLALDAPEAVTKTVDLLTKAPTQEEQLGYVLHLRNIKTGWTIDARKQYFSWFNKSLNDNIHAPHVVKWFEQAGRNFGQGNSLPNFINNFHKEAVATLSDEEKTALESVLAAFAPGQKKPKKPAGPQRKTVAEYTTADLAPLLEQVGKSRDFAKGKAIYAEAQCAECHKFGNEGNAVGPDLTEVSKRFKRGDLLESITEPSKVLSEQYANTFVKTTAGKVAIGRVVQETDDNLVLQMDMRRPEKETIKKTDIRQRGLSKTSPMPEGLLNKFTKEEILDLLAFIESGGNKEHGNFKK